ncbi:MAG TPA: hypothetical protein VKZ18_01285 [Polyangia bacterium]|nr:hypothetical protein [Polyangia bacterium]
MELAWFTALISAICFEGLGRKYIPGVPDAAFYFLKDVILLFGYLRFRPSPATWRVVRHLYRGFQIAFMGAFVWTLIEVFNPDQQSKPLALVGLRAYWLWWLAPPVIATALQKTRIKERAIYALLAVAAVVTLVAIVQFASPATSSINVYEGHGEEYETGPVTVESTGRARVSSTFTFVSGFVAFTLAVPTLLLSFGLEAKNPRLRTWALAGTMAAAAVVPMAGSRGSIVIGLAVLGLSVWSAGLFFTRVGRRVLIGGLAAAVVSVVAFPEAMIGVQSRFENQDDTRGRFEEVATLLPPVAIATYKYPPLGIGTGMQQNARFSFHVGTDWDVESELGRYLVELGPVGFVFFWVTKLGLMVGLVRAHGILKRAGRRGGAAAALSYAAMTMFGNLTFDHNWQALYFLGCGFVLSDVLLVVQQQALEARRQAAEAQIPAPPIREVAFAADPRP